MKKMITLSFILILLIFFLYCSSQKLMPGSESQISGGKKPKWVFDPTSQDTRNLKAFVGVSHDFKMEGDARTDALKDARQQIIDFMGVLGTRVIKEAIVTSGMSSDVINPAIASKHESEFLSESYIQTRAKNYHVERWQRVLGDNSVENFYKIYVLVQFDENDTKKYLKQALAEAEKSAKTEQEQRLLKKAEELVNGKSLLKK